MFESVNISGIRRGLLYTAVILIALTLQNEFIAHIKVFGMKPFYMPVLVTAIGMFHGGFFGGVMGLIAGALCDFSFHESTVTFMIAFTVIGFFAGAISRFYMNNKLIAFIALSAAALLLTGSLQFLRLLILQTADLKSGLLGVLLQTAVSLPFSVPLYYGIRNIALHFHN